MTYLLGVDGGTSKTKALICKLDGTVVGHARTGGSNIYEGDPQDGIANAMRAPAEALAHARIAATDLATSVFSMSGADWPEDMVFFRAAARAREFGSRIVVVNDAIGGLYAGLPGPDALAIICGTHAACAAKNAAGDVWHNSFWQMVGGGHDLGNAALKAVYMADLDIAPQTSLTAAILHRFEAASPADLLHQRTALFHEPAESAAELAPLVLEHAELGDPVAHGIVERQGHELARFGIAAAKKVGIEGQPFDLVLGGGIFRHRSRILPEAILEEIRITSPGVTITYRSHEPVVGAMLLAFEEHGIATDETLVNRLVSTLPEGWY